MRHSSYVRACVFMNIWREIRGNQKTMSLLELGPIAFGGTPAIVAFLQRKNVLASQHQCSCGTMMTLQERADVSDGCRWRCPSCYKAVTIRTGSFFNKSKIKLQKWLLLMHWWSRQYPVKDAAEEAGVSEPTAIQVYAWLRDVCSYRLCTIDPPIKLGGQGVIVSIDESLFSHTPKVRFKRCIKSKSIIHTHYCCLVLE